MARIRGSTRSRTWHQHWLEQGCRESLKKSQNQETGKITDDGGWERQGEEQDESGVVGWVSSDDWNLAKRYEQEGTDTGCEDVEGKW